jgi:nitrite reductase/ring-hydroxylating ferredoxin subunit
VGKSLVRAHQYPLTSCTSPWHGACFNVCNGDIVRFAF